MSGDVYVYSTLTADNNYTVYEKGGADLPVEAGSVLIRGGSNVADRRLHTPRGVVTKISAEQLKALRSNEVFKLHERNGYVTISDKKEDPEVVAADLTTRSPDAPLVDEDFGPDDPRRAGAAAPDVQTIPLGDTEPGPKAGDMPPPSQTRGPARKA